MKTATLAILLFACSPLGGIGDPSGLYEGSFASGELVQTVLDTSEGGEVLRLDMLNGTRLRFELVGPFDGSLHYESFASVNSSDEPALAFFESLPAEIIERGQWSSAEVSLVTDGEQLSISVVLREFGGNAERVTFDGARVR